MIYTVTTVEADFVRPTICTMPYGSIENAMKDIRHVIDAKGKRIADEEKAGLESKLAELEENGYGDLRFEAADFYINLDSFCSAY